MIDMNMIAGTPAELEVKRRLRAPLLKAFDVYKTNVQYGIIEETEAEHSAIIAWYHDLLDLEDGALAEAPQAVVRYL